jgi:hypothetical protein
MSEARQQAPKKKKHFLDFIQRNLAGGRCPIPIGFPLCFQFQVRLIGKSFKIDGNFEVSPNSFKKRHGFHSFPNVDSPRVQNSKYCTRVTMSYALTSHHLNFTFCTHPGFPRVVNKTQQRSQNLTHSLSKMTIMPSASDRKYRRGPRAPLLLPQSQKCEDREVGFDGASYSGAVFNLSTTIVGAGIMALPATMKQLGLIPGLIMIVLGATLTESSIDMILRFTRASKSATYSGLVSDAFGGPGRTLLQLCIVVNNMGMLVVYMIIIGTH